MLFSSLKKFTLGALVLPGVLAGSIPLLHAEDDNAPVSRAEFNELKAQLKASLKELKESKAELKVVNQRVEELTKAQSNPSAAGSLSLTDKLNEAVTVRTSGSNSKLTISGGASATFGSTRYSYAYPNDNGPYYFYHESQQTYNVNAFRASFNPIVQWTLSDRIKFDGDVDITFSDEETHVHLQTAELSYRVADYLVFGAGRFADPVNYFAQNLRKDWVNRLPTPPLAFAGYMLPKFQTGAEVSGVIPIWSAKLKYAFFLGNAPRQDSLNPFPDTNLGYGGSLGLEPIPGLEFGYGVEQINYKDSYYWDPFLEDNPLVHSAHLDFVHDFQRWGTVNFHSQWLWSNAMAFNWDPSELPLQPLGYDWRWESWGSYPYIPVNHFFSYPVTSKNNAGYLQLSYRPTQIHCFLRNFEPVFRYEVLGGGWKLRQDSNRWTTGLDYWLGETTLLKAAYEWSEGPRGLKTSDLYEVQVATEF